MIRTAWMLLGLVLPAAIAAAVTPEEDESRIEALILLEREASRPVAATELLPGAAESSRSVSIPSTTGLVDVPAQSRVSAAALVAPAKPATSLDAEVPSLRFDDLGKHIGQTLRITTANGKQRNARVQSADSRQVTLLVTQPGGIATYTLQRAQVAAIQALEAR